MTDEIKPSGTDWDHAAEQADWEKQAVDTIQAVLWKDFGDGDSIDEDVLDEKTIRTAYMGAGPVEEIVPSPIEKYVPPQGKGVDGDTQVTKWRLRYPDLTGIEIARKGEDGTPGDTLLKAEGSGVGQVFRGHLFVRPGFPCDVLLAAAGIWTKGFQAGKRSMDHRTRAKLYRELHELLNHAIDNMPDLEGTYSTDEDGDETVSVDLQDDIRERLQDARDELKGDTYHVDLPAFVVEVDEDEEDDAPAPRTETPDYNPDPFTGPNETAGLLAGPFSNAVKDSIMEADGEPAETRVGEWGLGPDDAPVRVEKLDGGNSPYEGRATLKVQARADADPAEVEAAMGWEMLERMDMDTVWLHLLLLAHASAPHRRGERQVMTIPRKRVKNVLGFHRGDGKSVEQRAEEVEQHIKALQSIYVRFQGVKRHGDRTRLTNQRNATPLWNIQMVEHADLFENSVRRDWVLKVKEGLWGEEFLHEWEKPQWAPLPKEWFDRIDRHGKDWTQRLAIALVFLFRINSKNGGQVKLSAGKMLDICGTDMSGSSRRVTERKRRLSESLDKLRKRYNIGVQAERIHIEDTAGISHADWKVRTATFTPPDSIDGELLRNESDGRPPLPDVKGGNWTAAQIKRLRSDLGLTQSEFAKKLGVSRQMVSRYENHHDPPSNEVREVLDKLDSRFR